MGGVGGGSAVDLEMRVMKLPHNHSEKVSKHPMRRKTMIYLIVSLSSFSFLDRY